MAVLMGMFVYLCTMELYLGYRIKRCVIDDVAIVACLDGEDAADVIISE